MVSKVATLNIFLETCYYLKSARSNFKTYFIPHKNTYCILSKYSWRLTQYYINRAVPNVPSNPRFVAENDLCYTTLDLEALNHLRSTPFSRTFTNQPTNQPTAAIVPFFSPLLGPLHWALIWSPLDSIQGKNLTCVFLTGKLFFWIAV